MNCNYLQTLIVQFGTQDFLGIMRDQRGHKNFVALDDSTLTVPTLN